MDKDDKDLSRLRGFLEVAEWDTARRVLRVGLPGPAGLSIPVPDKADADTADLREDWAGLDPRARWGLILEADLPARAITAAYRAALEEIRCGCGSCRCEPEEEVRQGLYGMLGAQVEAPADPHAADSPLWSELVEDHVPDPPWSLDLDVFLWRVLFHSYPAALDAPDAAAPGSVPASSHLRGSWARIVVSLLGLAPGMTCAGPLMSALRLPLREMLGARTGAGVLLGAERMARARDDFAERLARPLFDEFAHAGWIEPVPRADEEALIDLMWGHFTACLLFWLADRSGKYAQTLNFVAGTAGVVSAPLVGGGVQALRTAQDVTARAGWLDALATPGLDALPWPAGDFVRVLRTLSTFPSLGPFPAGRPRWGRGTGEPGIVELFGRLFGAGGQETDPFGGSGTEAG